MNFLVDFTALMSSLASAHRDLRHRTDEKHFFRGEVEEFFRQFRSDVNFPCLILEGSELDYSGSEYNVVKTRHGAFIVADTYALKDEYDTIQQKMSECERIGEEFVGKMLQLAEEGNAIVAGLDINSVSAVYMQNQTNRYAGCRFEFDIVQRGCLFNPNVWVAEDESEETTNDSQDD